MKNLKEIANELKIEIKKKKRDLSIIECDQIINDLKIEDLVYWTNVHPVSKFNYLNVAPRVPFRPEGNKIMSRCLGNVDKLDDRVLHIKKKEAIVLFKNKWADMRNDFEILRNNS